MEKNFQVIKIMWEKEKHKNNLLRLIIIILLNKLN